MARQSTFAFILLTAFVAGACTAPRAISPLGDDKAAELRLQAGDTIRIVTRDRQRFSFEITEVREAALAGMTVKPGPHESLPKGHPVIVPYTDIALVEVRQFNALRSAAVPAVVILVAAGIALQSMPVMPAP